LKFFQLNACQFFGKLFLQVFFVFAESDDVIVMKDKIGQLRIEFVLGEMAIDLLQIGEQGVFL